MKERYSREFVGEEFKRSEGFEESSCDKYRILEYQHGSEFRQVTKRRSVIVLP